MNRQRSSKHLISILSTSQLIESTSDTVLAGRQDRPPNDRDTCYRARRVVAALSRPSGYSDHSHYRERERRDFGRRIRMQSELVSLRIIMANSLSSRGEFRIELDHIILHDR